MNRDMITRHFTRIQSTRVILSLTLVEMSIRAPYKSFSGATTQSPRGSSIESQPPSTLSGGKLPELQVNMLANQTLVPLDDITLKQMH